MITMAFLILGFAVAKTTTKEIPDLPTGQYYAILDEFPTEKKNSYQATCQLVGSEFKILTYFTKTDNAKFAKPGDVFWFRGDPELIENEGNPFEFDYRKYLNNKKIGYRIFLKESQFWVMPNAHERNIFRFALIVRERLIQRLYESGISKEAVPLVASIAFGAREEVDQEVIRSFTNTGVIHVLAVSGMNVGLVYIILNFLLQFLKSVRGGTILYTLIIFSGIWGYALVTGMSASILRAAMMFTFVIVGRVLNRNTNIYNSLAVSAFFLIVWNPLIIADVGFQLSYAAVFSIALFQPVIYKIFDFRNWLTDNSWMLLSVTFAAQIGTLPFTLYYFHQFPVYFWLANLMVIPLVTLVLYLAFFVIGCSFLSTFFAYLIGRILEWSVYLILWIVHQVSILPHAVIDGLYPSLNQLMVLVTAFVLAWLFFRFRRSIFLVSTISFFVLFAILSCYRIYEKTSRAEMVFFKIKGTRLLAITEKESSTILYDRCEGGVDKLTYYLKPYLGDRKIDWYRLYTVNDTLKFQHRNLAIAGNMIFFRGVSLYFEPNPDSPALVKELPFKPDVVWRSAFDAKELVFEVVNGTKIQFCNDRNLSDTTDEGLKLVRLSLNKAVRMVFHYSSVSDADFVQCGYFNTGKE